MNPSLECLPCIVNYLIKTVSNTVQSSELQKEIVKEAMVFLSKNTWSLPPPLVAREINMLICAKTGISDTFRGLKDLSTEKALEILPELRGIVQNSQTPFETAVRISTAGNIIDFGACHDFTIDQMHSEIEKSLTQTIDIDAVTLLEKKISEARKILFIADNCGEAVLDRLLIEPIRRKTVIAVRGYPILNDITRREAILSGYDEITEIIDTGDSTPGVWLDYCSENFKEFFLGADLIISKGQGNYETLSETKRPIFFLLKAKCAVITSHLNTELGSLNVIHRNIR